MIDRLVLFGATGDLVGRYLLPALAALHASGRLPDGFQVVGAARTQLDDEGFRHAAAGELAEHAGDLHRDVREALVRCLRYLPVDLGDPASVARVIGDEGRPVVAYLALPPATYPMAVTTLAEVGLPDGSRVALEKPFGEDLDSAVALNGLVAEVAGAAGERAVFRIDHVLGLETVQNLLAMRLANRVLDAVWNAVHVEQVEILWEETLALEGRGGYFDKAGALVDMLQNHLLQILCFVAMEPPGGLDEHEVRDRKVELLRAVRPVAPDEVAWRSRRARYTAGRLVDGEEVPSYVDEDGVDPARDSETFAEVVLDIDNERWAGTRFVLRTAKALDRLRKEAVVRFRPAEHSPFAAPGAAGVPAPVHELRIGLDGPDDIRFHLAGGSLGEDPGLQPLTLAAPPPPVTLPAYGHVLLDILDGGCRLSVRDDEAEESWRVVTPVLDAWADGRVPMEEYPAGSSGPPPR